MKKWALVCTLVGGLGSLGCMNRAKEQVASAHIVASMALGCSLVEVELDQGTAGSGGSTTYKGTACGQPVEVRCAIETDPRYGKVTKCGVASPEQASAQSPVYVAPNAPKDQTVGAVGEEALEYLFELLEPCRQKALAAYPDAKARFLAGLPPQHNFFVIVRLKDARGYTEQIFVVVDSIEQEMITGRIWNDVRVLQGYQSGQSLRIAEADIVDWMISRPDGTEEGNWSGKFLDAYQATRRAPAGICDP